jgi:hypothetical protein
MRDELKDLLEAVEAAIASGDWKVDGACDPDVVIQRAHKALRETELIKEKLADSLEDLNKWSDLVRKGEAEVTSVSFKRVEK